VVAAASLAHDIGNPPFGHAGEDAIRLWFTTSATGQAVLKALPQAQQPDFQRFEGNAQGFRIITRLAKSRQSGRHAIDLRHLGHLHQIPVRRVAAGHPSARRSPSRNSASIRTIADLFAEVAGELGLEPVLPGAWSRHPLAYLVEAADDICYRIIDVEDAFRLQLLALTTRSRDLLLPLTGEPDRAQRKTASTSPGPRKKSNTCAPRPSAPSSIRSHQCFMAQRGG
jgi:dGTPase